MWPGPNMGGARNEWPSISSFLHAEPIRRWHNPNWNTIALISVADDAPWPQALM